MSFISSLLQRLVEVLEPYGAPGLMLIAIADSSFISLPEVNDLALMTLSIANPSSMWGLAAMTVIGSIIGCTLLYAVGRKGGEALLRKRFAAEKVARVRAWYDKYGMLAVIVPSLLPPPLPFKIFVLCAGAFRISWSRFMIAVGIGRSIRYFTEGILAVWYGKQAIQMVKDNSAHVGLILAGLIVLGTLIFVYSRRRRVPAGVLLLPLLCTVFFSGCIVRTTKIPEGRRMKQSYPFTRDQAIARLRQWSQTVRSLQAPIVLWGATPDLKDKNAIKHFPGVSGTLIIQRPGRMFLQAGLIGKGFEMASNGNQYEFFINSTNKQVHVGVEDAPPSKSSCKLGESASQFINMRPRQILQALLPDFRPLLDSTSTRTAGYEQPVIQDQKRYFIVDVHNISSPPEARLLEKVWFDLSSPDVDIVRLQVYDEDGHVERDIQYANHAPLGSAGVRYPMRFDVQFVPTETVLTITMDPVGMKLNGDVDPDAFELGTHKNAEVCTLEPAVAVSQR